MESINKYIGYKNQIYGVTSSILQGGRKQNTLIHYVKTGAGLEFVVNQDRCLDIPSLSFCGTNISYQGRDGIINSSYTNPYTSGAFNNYYSGGMLYTCGLKNVGPECIEDGIFYPTHGQIGTIPSSLVSIISNDDVIEITGEMHETTLFGSNLTLKRKIKSLVMKNEIEIIDEIENNGNKDELVYYLYHINFGYPFLDENVKIECDDESSLPRDDYSSKHMFLLNNHEKPHDDWKECVFFRKLKDINGVSSISVVNKKLGIKATICYENKHLPNLVQWSSVISHDYALGIEPSNTFVRGRIGEIEKENLPLLKKNQTITIRIKLQFERI